MRGGAGECFWRRLRFRLGERNLLYLVLGDAREPRHTFARSAVVDSRFERDARRLDRVRANTHAKTRCKIKAARGTRKLFF